MKLLSWNIWGGIFLPQVLEFLGSSGAHIIALQEVEEDKGTNTAQIIAETLGYNFIYARSMQYDKDGIKTYRGNAVLSKYPIIGKSVTTLSIDQSRVSVQAEIDLHSFNLHITSIHIIHALKQPSSLQEEQVETLISVSHKENSVIMGDFNMEPKNSAIAKMKKVFRDADEDDTATWCLYPDGPEFYKPESVVSKMDYIFVSTDIATRDFMVGESKASDHLPISVSLQL